VLPALLTACGEDGPAGTLSEDDVPVSATLKTRDRIANQVVCRAIDDAEDAIMDATIRTEDETPSVVFDLDGDEWVDNSVWVISNPDDAVAAVGAGVEACAAHYPETYRAVEVPDEFPGAVGYEATEGDPALHTHRILVPLEDRVVVVGVRRGGDDSYSVAPEDLLADAVRAAADAPRP
jgi:hypothetical protein